MEVHAKQLCTEKYYINYINMCVYLPMCPHHLPHFPVPVILIYQQLQAILSFPGIMGYFPGGSLISSIMENTGELERQYYLGSAWNKQTNKKWDEAYQPVHRSWW